MALVSTCTKLFLKPTTIIHCTIHPTPYSIFKIVSLISILTLFGFVGSVSAGVLDFVDYNITNEAMTSLSNPNSNYVNGIAPNGYASVSSTGTFRTFIEIPQFNEGGTYINKTIYHKYFSVASSPITQVNVTTSFSESTLIHNNAPSVLDSRCSTFSNSNSSGGFIKINISDCDSDYLAFPKGQADLFDDDQNVDSFVRYWYEHPDNYLMFLPNVSETNTTNISSEYYVSSTLNYFGNISIDLYAGSEFLTGGSITFDDITNVNYQYLLSSPYFSNQTLNLSVRIVDAIGVIYSDNITYNPSYVLPNPVINPPINITYPNFTPYPYPTWGNDVNTSINGSKMDNWSGYIGSTTGLMNGSVAGVFGFITIPITNLRGYVQFVNSSLVGSNNTLSGTILSIVCPCVISSIHWKVKSVMTFSLILMTVLIIMRKK